MKESNAAALVAISALMSLLLIPLSFSETGGTINLTNMQNSSSVVTGLWGATVTPTTTTTVSNTTTTVDIVTGYSNATTTTARTTTTTTVVAAATTTTAGATTTTIIIRNSNYSEGAEMTIESLQAAIEAKPGIKPGIEQYYGQAGSVLDLPATHEASLHMTIYKDLEIDENMNTSKIIIKTFYNGDRNLSNVVFFNIIPKEFAQSADSVEVMTGFDYVVVEKDPVYMFNLNNVRNESMFLANYITSGKADMSIDDVEVFYFVSARQQGGEPLPLWTYVIIFIALLCGAMGLMFKDEIMEKLGIKKRGKYAFKKQTRGFAEKVKEIIRKIREKLPGRKEDVKFVYKYEP
jgi:hypothetical protein